MTRVMSSGIWGRVNRSRIGPVSEPEFVPYKGYQIQPAPVALDDGGWTTQVYIHQLKGLEMIYNKYIAGNVWETKKEAIEGSAEYGRRIIDGKVLGLTPP